jgi:CHAT domain-containing protein
MVVAMPETENYPSLKQVASEIATIEGAFPQTAVLKTPTLETTLEYMQNSNIMHFICHGHSDTKDPSKSGLVLSSGSLTLGSLSQLYFPNPHFAYLSACSTAKTSMENLADEVLHLGSGFQLAGFPHVIATLWEVGDKEAVRVASDFYDRIKGIDGAYLEEGVVARALHDAVKMQRDRLPNDPIAWAAQVHFGP